MPWHIAGWSVSRVRVTAVALLVCATALTAGAAPGSASAAKIRKSSTKTFVLPAATTKTFDVVYPLALRFSGASYSCSATVLGLGKRDVTILSRGSALGGTVCRGTRSEKAPVCQSDTAPDGAVEALPRRRARA